jgi:DNA-binding GntR family transcriptional regulator
MIQPSAAFRTKEQIAYDTLRGAILRCELAPGDKLVIDRLSIELGLSQIPIRAAIQRLQAEGLVLITPHASATVARLTPEKINEVFVLLENLESAAFRIAAEKRSDADLAELEALSAQMEAALARRNPSSWLKLNIAFHRKIAAIASLPLLSDFTNRTLDEWERISHYYFKNVTSSRLPQAQQEHRQVIALLRDRDADALVALAASHNRAANLSYQALLK